MFNALSRYNMTRPSRVTQAKHLKVVFDTFLSNASSIPKISPFKKISLLLPSKLFLVALLNN